MQNVATSATSATDMRLLRPLQPGRVDEDAPHPRAFSAVADDQTHSQGRLSKTVWKIPNNYFLRETM
jgi:hypothetical protein